MKTEKAERILDDFKERKECPANVRKAIETLLLENLKSWHRVHFVNCYLHNMDSLSKEDIYVIQGAIQ